MKNGFLFVFLFFVSCALFKDGTTMHHINPPDFQKTSKNTHYSAVVEIGNDLFLSGISGEVFKGENAIEKQFDSTFNKLSKVLKTAGSDISHIKEIYTWHVDISKHEKIFLKVKDKYFPKPPYPTWTAVEIKNFFPGTKKLKVTARAEKIKGGDKLIYLNTLNKNISRLKYTPAIIDDDLVYLSGLSGVSKGKTVEEQFKDAFLTLKKALESVGSGLDEVIELDTFHVVGVNSGKNIRIFKKIRDEFIQKPIVWNPLMVSDIADPAGLLEITVRARLKNSKHNIRYHQRKGSKFSTAIEFKNIVYIGTLFSAGSRLNIREKEQYSFLFEQLKKILRLTGLSINDLMEVNTFHTKMTSKRFFNFLKEKNKHILPPYSAWSGIGVGVPFDNKSLVTLSARAFRKEK